MTMYRYNLQMVACTVDSNALSAPYVTHPEIVSGDEPPHIGVIPILQKIPVAVIAPSRSAAMVSAYSNTIPFHLPGIAGAGGRGGLNQIDEQPIGCGTEYMPFYGD
jgi:hypothetical protein